MPTSSGGSQILKRAFDFLSALFLLILLAPLMVCVGLFIRYLLGAPVLFRQIRPGLNGEPFTVLKFRSMSDATGNQGVKLSDEQRLGRTGKLIRSLSLDELPQLVNVLRGEMSLVGPRPLLMEYLQLYSYEERRRHSVRPGITGWAQVNGRNSLSWKERFSLDLWYVDHWSFFLDLRILVLTVWTVSARRGVSQIGRSTMERFDGTN